MKWIVLVFFFCSFVCLFVFCIVIHCPMHCIGWQIKVLLQSVAAARMFSAQVQTYSLLCVDHPLPSIPVMHFHNMINHNLFWPVCNFQYSPIRPCLLLSDSSHKRHKICKFILSLENGSEAHARIARHAFWVGCPFPLHKQLWTGVVYHKV